MSKSVVEAIVKATGRQVKVYKLKSGGWALYDDGGKTTFQDHELKFN